MSERRCWLLHKWGRWIDFTMIVQYTLYGVDMGYAYRVPAQYRVCHRCGLRRERQV